MSENAKPFCPECEEQVTPPELDRRRFIRVLGGSAATILAAGAVPTGAARALANQVAQPAAPRTPRPSERLVQELYATLTPDQRRQVVHPWNHGAENGRGIPTRHGMFNRALDKKIGDVYTPAQQELLQRILRSISSDDEGYRRITRNGTFDASQSFQNCGA